MKHLHLEFIAASCALGFGVFMLALAGWQAQAVTTGVRLTLDTLSPMIDLFVGVVLVAFGVVGIRQEVLEHDR